MHFYPLADRSKLGPSQIAQKHSRQVDQIEPRVANWSKEKAGVFLVSLHNFTSLLSLVNIVLLEREKPYTLGQNDTSTYKIVEMCTFFQPICT